MTIVVQIEHSASSSRSKHEGESSFALCDRLSRTRDNNQRQLPTDHDYAVPTLQNGVGDASAISDFRGELTEWLEMFPICNILHLVC